MNIGVSSAYLTSFDNLIEISIKPILRATLVSASMSLNLRGSSPRCGGTKKALSAPLSFYLVFIETQ